MNISVDQVARKMKEREAEGQRAILWSINMDARELVQCIAMDFGLDRQKAKRIAFKVIKKAILEVDG